MVDVVDLDAVVVAQRQQVLHRVDEVLGPQRHLGLGDVLVELAVEAEPADAPRR